MLTKRDYCDYDTCVALKELGYPLTSTEIRYENKAVFVHGILLYSAQKFLREEKNIIVLVHHIMTEQGDWEWELSYKYRSKSMYASYESALLEGIKEAVKILKERYDKDDNTGQ